MDKILEAKNITKNYPGVIALADVNFNVYKGKVNVLVGENGAGKSTLMKILSGVEKQTSGDIFLDNQKLEINSTKDAESNSIGIIHQELNLFPNLTVHENIFMGHELMNRYKTVNVNAQIKVTFQDLWPVTLSGIQMDSSVAEVDYITADATFAYTIYKVERLIGEH